MKEVYNIFNCKILERDNCIFVFNRYLEIVNIPFKYERKEIIKDKSFVGVWKIKQLKVNN